MYYKKHTKIYFNPKDTDSIIAALKQYQTLLEQNAVFALKHHCFDIEFLAKDENEPRPLQLADINLDEVLTWINEATHLGPDSYQIPQQLTDKVSFHVSEILLFAIALNQIKNQAENQTLASELEAQLVATAKAMGTYARNNNDSNKMWLDDSRIFGAEALYLMARFNPQYNRYLAQFFIANWDEYLATQYASFLADLVTRNGWTKDNIELFVWCDNRDFRQKMFVCYEQGTTHNQPLIEVLRQDTVLYTHFKTALIQRLLDTPICAGCEYEAEQNKPVLNILLSTLAVNIFDVEDEQSEFNALLESTFVDDSIDNTAYQLQTEIEAQTSHPLIYYRDHYSDDEEYEDDVKVEANEPALCPSDDELMGDLTTKPDAAQKKRLQTLLEHWQEDPERLHQPTFEHLTKLLKEVPKFADPQQWLNEQEQSYHFAHYALMAWLLHSELPAIKNNSELKQQLEAIFNSPTPWQLCVEHIIKYCNKQNTAQIEQLQQQLLDPTANSKALAEQLSYLLSHEMDKINDKVNYHRHNANQPHYHLFEADRRTDSNDSIYIILLCFWQLNQQEIAQHLWQVLSKLAPMAVLKPLAKLFSRKEAWIEFAPNGEQAFQQLIKEANAASDEQLNAFMISLCDIHDHPKNYATWLDNFADLANEPESAKFNALKKNLGLINQGIKLKFYQQLMLRHPQISINQLPDLQQDIEHGLKLLMARNMVSWETVLQRQFANQYQEINGSDYKKQNHSLIADDNMRVKELNADLNSWYNIALIQQRGDDHAALYYQYPLPTDEINGTFIVFDEAVDTADIYQAMKQMPNYEQRLAQLTQHLLWYLDGQVSLKEMQIQFSRHLRDDNYFDIGESYNRGNIRQLMWLLDDNQRQRLITLLCNHHANAFELIKPNELVQHWYRVQVINEQFNHDHYLALLNDDANLEQSEEQAMAHAIAWISQLPIELEHMLIHWLPYAGTQAIQDWINQLARSGQLVPALKHISIEDRQSIIDAIDIHALKQRPRDYLPLLSTLQQDKSARVRKHLENSHIPKQVLTDCEALQLTEEDIAQMISSLNTVPKPTNNQSLWNKFTAAITALFKKD